MKNILCNMFVYRLSILFMSFDNTSETETGDKDFAIYIEVGELMTFIWLVLYRLVQRKILSIKIEMESKLLTGQTGKLFELFLSFSSRKKNIYMIENALSYCVFNYSHLHQRIPDKNCLGKN